jgi:hypothetical protein
MNVHEPTFDIRDPNSQITDIVEFRSHMLLWQAVRKKHTLILYVIAALCFGGGLLALYFDFTFITVVLLALAAYFNQESDHHNLLAEMMDMQWSLALLINKHTRDLEVLRGELKQERNSKSS